MEETGRRKRSEITVFALIAIVGINLVFTFVLYDGYEKTRMEYESTSSLLKSLMSQVQATSQYVAIGNITLKFQPFMQNQMVSGNTITYLLGFVTVTNLTNIIARPLTLTILFEPNVTYPEWGNVSYDYTNFQTLEIPPGVNDVMMPWGAFPVTLTGFRKGDVIVWDMLVTATATWVNIEVARVSMMVSFKLIVV